ncbi:MAG: ATP-binding protein [Spirochaetes bacterium]|nr:ATP-binding protein [Spirochaetota bacterium]
MQKNVVKIHSASYSSQKGIRSKIIEEVVLKIHEQNINLGLSREELFLVIDEALTNAMEHGNKWDPSKKVNINVQKNSQYLEVSIEDEGEGFNFSGVGLSNSGLKSLHPRGRGVFIIRQFCEPIWNEKGNKITLRFPIAR